MHNLLIRAERPHIHEQLVSITFQLNDRLVGLEEMEQSFLEAIAACSGQILDNTATISQLSSCKERIKASLAEVEQFQQNLQRLRESCNDLKVVASRCTLLFKTVCGMSRVHPMYQISFGSFEQLLERASAQAARTALSKTQVLMETITAYVFRMVTRGYFDVHRQLFALQLVFHTLKQQEILTDPMLLFIVRGSISTISAPPKPMQLSWLTMAQWQDLHLLQAVGPSVFQNLVASVTSDGTWRNWVLSDDPERTSPVGISINLQALPSAASFPRLPGLVYTRVLIGLITIVVMPSLN